MCHQTRQTRRLPAAAAAAVAAAAAADLHTVHNNDDGFTLSCELGHPTRSGWESDTVWGMALETFDSFSMWQDVKHAWASLCHDFGNFLTVSQCGKM